MTISDYKIIEELIQPLKVINPGGFRPIQGFSIDSRSIGKGQAFLALRGKHRDGHDFIREAVSRGASCVIAEKDAGITFDRCLFVVKDTYRALSRAIKHIRTIKNPYVYAITGSIGKTTTKEMLAFLLEPYYRLVRSRGTENNILGVAKTVFSLGDEEVLILELGTSAKGEIKTLSEACIPDVGIITFIKPAHLKGLGSIQGIIREKTSLFKANVQMKIILNRDDPYLSKIRCRQEAYWFGQARTNDVFARLMKREKGISHFAIQGRYPLRMPCCREHFIANVLAAISGARLLGLSIKESAGRMDSFKAFPSMRMETRTIRGFFIVNDAYNANPYSFEQALGSLRYYSLRKIAVIGDMLDLGDRSRYYHRSLAPQIMQNNFDYCLTLGRHSRHLKDELSALGHRGAFHFRSHKTIAGFIKRNIGLKTSLRKEYLIFLKGSRDMELERVLNYL
jgi:UDP-N-acetylmuramoyl-tripeptide--D-alanyl-D-alanine ligase